MEETILPHSAILIPLITINDKKHILYERRALDLDFQPGDVCFPGGGVDEDETDLEAAIRESCEELLIKKENLNNISYFDSFVGPFKKSIVSVFFGELVCYNNTYSKIEVDSVFTVPVDGFPKPIEENEHYPTYIYKGYKIWGFTARVTKEFLNKYYGI